jgi:hypothetical protein
MANADCQQQNPKATLASIDSAFQNNDFWSNFLQQKCLKKFSHPKQSNKLFSNFYWIRTK